jgi:hypothetical protein
MMPNSQPLHLVTNVMPVVAILIFTFKFPVSIKNVQDARICEVGDSFNYVYNMPHVKAIFNERQK